MSISNRFTVLDSLMDPVAARDPFICDAFDATREYIGGRPKIRQNGISQEILELKEACHTRYMAENEYLGSLLVNNFVACMLSCLLSAYWFHYHAPVELHGNPSLVG